MAFYKMGRDSYSVMAAVPSLLCPVLILPPSSLNFPVPLGKQSTSQNRNQISFPSRSTRNQPSTSPWEGTDNGGQSALPTGERQADALVTGSQHKGYRKYGITHQRVASRPAQEVREGETERSPASPGQSSEEGGKLWSLTAEAQL